MTNTPNRNTAATARRPDCVTEVRRGNTVLVVSGCRATFYKGLR